MTTHTEAKQIVDSLGLTEGEALAVRLVGLHETHYGDAWKGDGKGSNNWGSITAPRGGPDTFRHTDSRYDPTTQTVVKYETNFQRYATPRAGAEGLARVLLKDNTRAAIAAHDLTAFAAAMRANRFYLGTKPLAESIEDYAGALERGYATLQRETGETWFDRPLDAEADSSSLQPFASALTPFLRTLSRSLPVLRSGVRGDLVGVLQFELAIDPDEVFGAATDAAVRAFQVENELEPDGVVGPQTWAALFARRAPAAAET